MATNELVSSPLSATQANPNINAYVLQAAVCESAPYETLQPKVSCTACQTISATCDTSDTPCASAFYTPSPAPNCTPCAQDVCIARHTSSNCSSATVAVTTRTDGQCVNVTVGYNFTPITFLIQKFFSAKACWSGDTTRHTICATSTGKVL
jgi:hypothetical protein